MKVRSKFLIGSGIIVITLVSLAYAGFTQSKTYYHTITELSTLQGAALHQRMRVSGNVRNGSILRAAGRVDFVLEEQGKTVPVRGTWRDGYVELEFPFDWPAGMNDGVPGPTKAFMDGWIDGDEAKGRIRVDGRADGMWTAVRKSENAKAN